MSKTTKVVLIVTAVFLACVIGVGIVLGVAVNREGGVWEWRNLIGGEQFAIDETEEFDLDGVQKIKVDCTSGDVHLIPSDETKATLTGTVISSSRLEQYLNVYQEGTTLIIKVDYAHRFFDIHTNIDLDVYIPSDSMLDLEIVSTSGNLDIAEFALGDVDIKKTSGDAIITGCTAASVKYGSSSGDTDIQSCAFGSLTLGKTSGDIEILDTTGAMNISSTSGNTKIENADGALDIASTSGNVIISVADADIEPITVGVTSGDIRLYLPAETAFDLEAKTTSGNVSSEIDVVVVGSLNEPIVGDDVQGSANGGGSRIYAKTTSGNVRIMEK